MVSDLGSVSIALQAVFYKSSGLNPVRLAILFNITGPIVVVEGECCIGPTQPLQSPV